MTAIELQSRLRENVADVRERIAEACRRADRAAESVRVLAVTKVADLETIRALLAIGVVDLGENRVQQLVQRIEALGSAQAHLGDPGPADQDRVLPRWHMIGHLQRNKVRKLVEQVRILHSLDSRRLAEEVERQAAACGAVIDALVEVNVSGEPRKAGATPEELPALLESIAGRPALRLRGLMTMAPLVDDPEQARPVFARLREVLEGQRRRGVVGAECRELSMGMSNDYQVAIEEGATIVRIGSALYEGLR